MTALPGGQALSGYVSYFMEVSQEPSRVSTGIISVAFMGKSRFREMKYVFRIIRVTWQYQELNPVRSQGLYLPCPIWQPLNMCDYLLLLLLLFF